MLLSDMYSISVKFSSSSSLLRCLGIYIYFAFITLEPKLPFNNSFLFSGEFSYLMMILDSHLISYSFLHIYDTYGSKLRGFIVMLEIM